MPEEKNLETVPVGSLGIISMDKTTGTINPTKLGAWVQVRLQEAQKEV